MQAPLPESPAALPFGHHHAFIVGIDRYAKVSPLKTAVSDARRLAEVLAESHHFLVHTPALDPTGAELRTLLRETLTREVAPGDRVLFYFAGHGIAADGDDGPAGYLVPADGDPADLATFVPMAELQAALQGLPCRHLLLILDCCFSGAFKWNSQTRAISTLIPKRIYKERFDRFVLDPAWQVITSAAYDQKAMDVLNGHPTGDRGSGAEGRHSPFALALFDGLAGAADASTDREGDGVITATELYSYIRDRVEPQTLAASQSQRQTPGFFPLARHDKGEFVFLHPRHRLNLPSSPDRNPFQGLASFDESDRLLFYGRDRAIAELQARCETARLLVVSGASGTGKSSVIKAGLLPLLRDAGHAILPVMRPGEHPLAELEKAIAGLDALPATGQSAVLVIDQYEELITRCASADERQRFDARLCELLEKEPRLHRVILTVRSDFEPQLNSGALKALWKEGRCTVPPFSLEELREVIQMPTIQEVMIFDPPKLVDEIMAEVVQSPGVLPLLSYALSELYEASRASGRQDRALTQADYDQIGGVLGALRTKADALYRALTPPEQETMRKIMLRMVSVEGDLAGRRVALDDLAFGDDEAARVDKVLEALVNARLIVKGEGYVEPAHDALVRAWKTLHDWIHELGKDRLILGLRLNAAANEYTETGDSEFLWNRNPNLPVVQSALGSPRHGFNAREAAFIRASVRRKRQLALILGSVVAGVVVALASLSAWAWIEQRNANGTITQARGFTDELMFRIVDRLRAIEKTREVRKDLVERVGQLHEKLGQVGAQDDTSTRFWKAILQGDIEMEAQNGDAARRMFDTARAIAQPLADRPAWERNLSVAYGKLGDLALSREVDTPADVAAARGWYERALAIDQRLVARDAANRVWQRDLLISQQRLGDLEFDADRLQAAQSQYAASLKLAEALAQDPHDVLATRDRLAAYARLGSLEARTGNFDAARERYAQALLLADTLARDSRDTLASHDLLATTLALADMEKRGQQAGAARVHYLRAMALAQSLAQDPRDAAAQRGLALSLIHLGHMAYADWDPDHWHPPLADDAGEARAHYEQAHDAAERLADHELGDLRLELCISLWRLADLRLAEPDGLADARRALQLALKLARRAGTSAQWQRAHLKVLLDLGGLEARDRQYQTARGYYAEAATWAQNAEDQAAVRAGMVALPRTARK